MRAILDKIPLLLAVIAMPVSFASGIGLPASSFVVAIAGVMLFFLRRRYLLIAVAVASANIFIIGIASPWPGSLGLTPFLMFVIVPYGLFAVGLVRNFSKPVKKF